MNNPKPTKIEQATPQSQPDQRVGADAVARGEVMDARTLTALRGSIAKWKAIEAGVGRDEGPNNCPLCQLFWKHKSEDDPVYCIGCPVREATGKHGCEGTPYEAWTDAESRYDNELITKKALLPFARDEREFLESLLPAGELK